MNVPKEVMKFRIDRATELERFATTIQSVGIEFNNISPIYSAIGALRDNRKGFHTPSTTDYQCWGYDIDELMFLVPPPKRHINVGIDTMEIIVSCNVLSDCNSWANTDDPFHELNFNVKVRGLKDGVQYGSGFHIDRQKDSDPSDELHPLYHLHYTPKVFNDQDAGMVLAMDAPRMIHAPVDLILGLDIVFSNFAMDQWDTLKDSGAYNALCRSYQNSIWKPYIQTWASFWAFDHSSIKPERAKLICPYLG